MFAGGRRKSSLLDAALATDLSEPTSRQQLEGEAAPAAEEERERQQLEDNLAPQLQQRRPLGSRGGSPTSFVFHGDGDDDDDDDDEAEATKTSSKDYRGSSDDDERQRILKEKAKVSLSPPVKPKFAANNLNESSIHKRKKSNNSNQKKQATAKLAKQESIEPEESLASMLLGPFKQKRVFIPLLMVLSVVAVYCIPFVEIEPRFQKRLPPVPFNYKQGPLSPSSASAFKVEHLFFDQLHGPESGAIDSAGNMYLAVEGGFILYAHLNKRSQPIRAYYEPTLNGNSPVVAGGQSYPELVKIAELNGIRQLPYNSGGRGVRDATSGSSEAGHLSWRRECQLDEKVYGPNMVSGGVPPFHSQVAASSGNTNEMAQDSGKFVSKVKLSRCSKPLGVRLSPDESYLYVIDTLSGLYRISLRTPERAHTTQRLVTRLIDFKANRHQLLPIVQLENNGDAGSAPSSAGSRSRSAFLNITLMALDDLVVDYGAGTRGGDIIYMTDASQKWIAVSYFYDMLEAEGTGVVLRFDTDSSQLSVLNPSRVTHVRGLNLESAPNNNNLDQHQNMLAPNSTTSPYLGIGAPRLDENDIFDDRPLHFPNGLELTEDKQAILIADTTNKRIIKHYIRGARRGTSDLWAWTPMFPDNIRRGFGQAETFWVIGCGQDTTSAIDLFDILHSWPMLRKLVLKNVYLFGWVIENIGAHLLNSVTVRDFGYSFRTGSTICERVCPGMMIVQYNNQGDIIRSIYSSEFPSDLVYYAQVSEFVDANSQEHILYLSSPSYNYLTKLTLPSNSFNLPTSTANQNSYEIRRR